MSFFNDLTCHESPSYLFILHGRNIILFLKKYNICDILPSQTSLSINENGGEEKGKIEAHMQINKIICAVIPRHACLVMEARQMTHHVLVDNTLY